MIIITIVIIIITTIIIIITIITISTITIITITVSPAQDFWSLRDVMREGKDDRAVAAPRAVNGKPVSPRTFLCRWNVWYDSSMGSSILLTT